MSLKSLKLIPIVAILSLSSAAHAEKKLVLASDDWCPYTCDGKDANKQGYMVEVAKHALAMHGITVEYKVMPLHEAFTAANQGTIDGVIAIAKQDNGLVYPEKPQSYTQRVAYIRENDNWKYDSADALKGKKLCAVEDYSMDNYTKRYFTDNYSKHPSDFLLTKGVSGSSECLAAVSSGQADVYIGDKNVITYELSTMKLPAMQLKAVSVMGAEEDQPLFIAFSPKLKEAREYADQLVSAVESMKATGDLKSLLVKYGFCKNGNDC